MALNKIDLEVPLTMKRGVGLHVRSAYRNGPIYIVHLNDMLFGMSECASVENLVKVLCKYKRFIPIQKSVSLISGHPLYVHRCQFMYVLCDPRPPIISNFNIRPMALHGKNGI